MKVLVTGSDGYIGTLLVQMLLRSGVQVVGLDTGYYRTEWLYNGMKRLPSMVIKDVRNLTVHDLSGFQAVIHLAELSNDPLGTVQPELTYDINHMGTIRLARLSQKAGVQRFLYSSSCSVYGATDEYCREDSKTNPLTIYAKCKVLNERALLSMASENFSPVILRNATAFGPSQRMRFDLVVNNLVALAFTKKEIRLESDGVQWRPFVHVMDICKAFSTALQAPQKSIHTQIFNVGSTSG